MSRIKVKLIAGAVIAGLCGMVFLAAILAVIAEEITMITDLKRKQAEELQDDQEDVLEPINFRLRLSGGKARTDLYGEGWEVEKVTGEVTGDTFTGKSEEGQAKSLAIENGGGDGKKNVTYVKKGRVKWNLRKQARKTGKLKGFGANQGVCTDGRNLYVAYSDSRAGDSNAKRKAKIVKYNIATKEIVAISPKAYKLGHTNDLAYDESKNCLLSTFSQTAGRKRLYLDLLDPDTLEKIGRVDIQLPKKLPGLSKKQRKRIRSFSGIDVDNVDHEINLRCRSTNYILVVDADTFVAKRGYKVHGAPPGVCTQGITMDGYTLYRAHANGQTSTKNIVDVISNQGKLLKRVQLDLTGELEGLFIYSGSLYGTVFSKPSSKYGSAYVFKISMGSIEGSKGDETTIYKPKNKKEKNAYAVWQALKRAGCTDEASAGVLGNVEHESAHTWDPMIVQGGGTSKSPPSGVGWGICQWTSAGRQKGLLNYAKKHHLKPYSIEAQAGWLVKELDTEFAEKPGWKYTGKTFRRIRKVGTATKSFCYQWERPGVVAIDSRLSSAKKWYKKFKGIFAVLGAVDISGKVDRIQEGNKVRYVVHFDGTMDGLPIAGAAELTKKQYRKFKQTGELEVEGDGQYGPGASWDNLSAPGAGAAGALAWGKKICDDDRYTYGDGACHTCGRSGFHYVCTTFVIACYAHGAKDSDMLKHCKGGDGGGIGMVFSSFQPHLRQKSDRWKELGNIPEKDLKPGDVLIFPVGHTEIYYGRGDEIGAHDWGGAESISKKPLWTAYTNVFRYKGG